MKKNHKITCLITSGGTKVPIDMVRSITNMSRGTFGSQIADSALEHFWDVTFLHAVDSKLPEHYWDDCQLAPFHPVPFVTFDDYHKALMSELKKKPDVIILAAAVSDYGVENYVDGKIRSDGELVIRLKPLPKLIAAVRKHCPKAVLCGFKLLVNSTCKQLLDACINSINKNDCDVVVGNDLRDIKNNDHKLLIVRRLGKTNFLSLTFTKKMAENERRTLASYVVAMCNEKYEVKNQ